MPRRLHIFTCICIPPRQPRTRHNDTSAAPKTCTPHVFTHGGLERIGRVAWVGVGVALPVQAGKRGASC